MKALATLGGAPPILVGGVRAVVEVGILAALGAVIVEVREIDWKQYVSFAPLVFGGLRALEGLADEVLDPDQNRSGIPSGAVSKYLGGIGHIGPAAVGVARGALEVGVLSGLGFLMHTAEAVEWGDYMIFAPVLFGGIRWLESFADQLIDPSQNRAPAR